MKKIITTFLLAMSSLLALPASAQTMYTIVGSGPIGFSMGSFSGDGGQGWMATLHNPAHSCFHNGEMYIADARNNRVRKVSATGIITTVAGTGTSAAFPDGIPATSAGLGHLSSVTFDKKGNMLIVDGKVRRVDTNGIITTIAGAGFGFAGDGGPAIAALFNNADRAIADSIGNIYICDWGNNRLRKVDTFGIITTIAGNGTAAFSGDGGPATAAGLTVGGFVFDNAGNIIIADPQNNRIRKITPAGIISTIAGTGVGGFGGDGGPATAAKFQFPVNVLFDASGNLIVADENNHRLRIITPSGIISTMAGTGMAGYSGDGGSATSAKLNYPHTVFMDHCGNFYIADLWNHRIRKISDAVPVVPSFTASVDTVCQDSCITFNNTSTGGIDSMKWEFTGASTLSPSTSASVSKCFPAPGLYTVTLSVYGTCTYYTQTATRTVYVRPKPMPSITTSGHVLTATAGYANYQWLLGGVPIAGATNSSYTFTASGSYSVVVDSGGCSGTASLAAVNAITSTFADATHYWLFQDGDGTLSVYSSVPPNEQFTVGVFDMSGRKVLSQPWLQGSDALHLGANSISPGLYIIRVDGPHTAEVLKWVKR